MQDDNTETIQDEILEGIEDTRSGSEIKEIMGKIFSKPKRQPPISGGRITIDEKQRRQAEIRACVNIGMTVMQMVDFLPTRGMKLSRSAIYDYLGGMKLPKNYKPGQNGQSHHDYFTIWALIHIAQTLDLEMRNISKGKSPGDGAGFRHDFSFEVDKYLFYGEVQLSDLTQTNWRKKAKNYVRWYEKIRKPFRVLFVIDQKKDMAFVRRHCRQVLKETGHPELELFLFCTLDGIKQADIVYEPAWLTASGKKVPLVLS